LIYFLLDNKSLSVYTESSTKQNLSLASKAKLHLSISNTINDSKKLNSIIARALDEISEEINLTNNLASIIIDDSILSHSIVLRSKKYDNIDQQIKEESELKWGDNTSNYFFISEEKKTPKNIFHSVAIHHLLREKIKLNFNNFGLSIKYMVPLSSILTVGLKPSQFSVIKNGNKYQFFGNTRKGFMFFKLNFSGSKKVEEKIIGLLDIPKIKKSDLVNQNLKFIFFNKTISLYPSISSKVLDKNIIDNLILKNNLEDKIHDLKFSSVDTLTYVSFSSSNINDAIYISEKLINRSLNEISSIRYQQSDGQINTQLIFN